jgi:hypothetical protein
VKKAYEQEKANQFVIKTIDTAVNSSVNVTSQLLRDHIRVFAHINNRMR